VLGIVQNHHFEQGNKRTALVAALIFLELNGYRFEIDDEIYLADLIRSAAAKKVSEPDFVRIIRTFIAPK